MTDPVVVLRTHSDIEASIVIGLLDAHGIPASLASDVPHAVFPLTINGLGEVRVSVPGNRAEEASRILADYRRAGGAERAVKIGEEFEALEAAIGHRFKDRGTLEHALTHRSRANEDVTGGVFDNESLEFLGDAVLGFVIAETLFVRFPDRDEGKKSKMKAALVSTQTLAGQAERLGLGAHLLLGRGEEKTGGRQKRALLADGYEAIIAAVYLDGGMEAARGFIAREFEALIDQVAADANGGGDHKSALQEALQGRGDPLPEYVVTAEEGPAHRRRFRIEVRLRGETLAEADGRTKKEAEQEAARLALERLTPRA
ncbi:MAG TPA: ribonuclease III [Vicinamibacterales bacterium]|nr:ribonuclease III [Vicinamibacterales bacterium]